MRVLTQAADCLYGNFVCALWGAITSVASHSLLSSFIYERTFNYLVIANVTLIESRFKHPLRGSAMNQRNKLHLLYRLTSERI